MEARLRVCPHCWGVNPTAERLCGRCGADMQTLLQESGGLRRTAAVQSPVPVRPRLSAFQRALVLGFIVLLALAHLMGALQGLGRKPGVPLSQPLGTGQPMPAPAPQ
jgi:hypothetical protein